MSGQCRGGAAPGRRRRRRSRQSRDFDGPRHLRRLTGQGRRSHQGDPHCGLQRGHRVDASRHQEHALLLVRDTHRARPANHTRRHSSSGKCLHQRGRHRVSPGTDGLRGDPSGDRIDRLSGGRAREGGKPAPKKRRRSRGGGAAGGVRPADAQVLVRGGRLHPRDAAELPRSHPGTSRLDADGQRHAPRRLGPAGCAQPARSGVVRLPVLHRHVGRAQAPLGQHAHADRHRHQCRLPLFGGRRRLPRSLPAHGARRGVLGRDDGGHRARRSRPRPRDQGQGAYLRGDQEADRAAGQERTRVAGRQGDRPARGGGRRRRHRRHPSGRQGSRRWRGQGRRQCRRRVDGHRQSRCPSRSRSATR